MRDREIFNISRTSCRKRLRWVMVFIALSAFNGLWLFYSHKTTWATSVVHGRISASKATILIVCHPDDESIFGELALGSDTHVVLVTNANASGKGLKRLGYLDGVLKTVQTTWEGWDFPETKWKGPKDCNGWNSTIQQSLVRRIEAFFVENPTIKQVITHNIVGEYGHVDHRNTHRAVFEAFFNTFAGCLSAPSLNVFVPMLDYARKNRLRSLPVTCKETPRHESMLSKYEAAGGLENAEHFRRICYKICRASLRNSILRLHTFKNTDCASTVEQDIDVTCENEFSAAKILTGRVFADSRQRDSSNEHVLQRETPDIDWKKNEDRIFMTAFYPLLKSFTSILDVGMREYNLRCKDLVGDNTEYMQLEPNPPARRHNDGTLKCSMQQAILTYPQLTHHFDAIIDFGVLGWPAIKLSEKDVQEYLINVRALLKEDGMYILKVDRGAKERIDFENNIEPFFHHTHFHSYEDGQLIDGKGKRIYFLNLK